MTPRTSKEDARRYNRIFGERWKDAVRGEAGVILLEGVRSADVPAGQEWRRVEDKGSTMKVDVIPGATVRVEP